MQRRVVITAILVLCALVMSLSASAHATTQIDPQDGVFTLANTMPANVAIYASLRADEAYIATLDGLLGKFGGVYGEVLDLFNAPFGLDTRLTINDLFGSNSISPNSTIGEVLAAVGDEIAVGITTDRFTAHLAVTLNDSAAFIALLEANSFSETGVEGGYRVFFSPSYLWYVTDSLAIGRPFEGDVMAGFPAGEYVRLSDSSAYQSALAALPAYQHDFFAYFNTVAVNRDDSLQSVFAVMGFEPEAFTISAGAFADGALSLDFTALPAGNEEITPPVISADFARHAPRDADAVIHGANLAPTLRDLLERVGAGASIEQIQAASGLNIVAFLDALGDEYILYTSYDPRLLSDIINSPSASPFELLQSIRFGVALQMKDALAAQAQAQALTQWFTALDNLAEEISVSTEMVGDVSVTGVTLFIPVNITEIWELTLLLVAQEDVLHFGTTAEVTQILNDEGGYTNAPNYGLVMANALENATTVGYLGSDGTLLLAAVPALTVVGSRQVGSASSTTSMELGTVQAVAPEATVELSLTQAAALTLTPEVTEEPSPTPIPSPTPTPTATPNFPVVIPQVIERIARLLPGASFSTSYDTDGIHRLRFTLSLGE